MFSEGKEKERAEQTSNEAVTVTSACPNEINAVCGRVLLSDARAHDGARRLAKQIAHARISGRGRSPSLEVDVVFQEEKESSSRCGDARSVSHTH